MVLYAVHVDVDTLVLGMGKVMERHSLGVFKADSVGARQAYARITTEHSTKCNFRAVLSIQIPPARAPACVLLTRLVIRQDGMQSDVVAHD